MVALIAEVWLTRRRAGEIRVASEALRSRNRRTVERTRITIREHQLLYERLFVPSPWSDLPWRLPERDLDRVLVPLAGDRL